MKKLIAKEFLNIKMTSVFVSMTDYIELDYLDGNTKNIDIEEKIKFYEKDDYTIICEIDQNGYIAKGKSRCHPDDTFDLLTGMTIAMGRAKSNLYKKITDDYINNCM